jgi:hypothetical protein
MLEQWQVTVDGQPLLPTAFAQRVASDGYGWGYEGSGAAALAHTLLAYEFDEARADTRYLPFTSDVIAALDPGAAWTLTGWEIRAWWTTQGWLTAITDRLERAEVAWATHPVVHRTTGTVERSPLPSPPDDPRGVPIALAAMTKQRDDIHPYPGYGRPAGRCRIRVYTDGQVVIVVCTEQPNNPGPSITEVAEYLATSVWEHAGRPTHMYWIEHYAPGVLELSDSFSLITFHQSPELGLSSPSWHSLTRAEVEAIIGVALD